MSIFRRKQQGDAPVAVRHTLTPVEAIRAHKLPAARVVPGDGDAVLADLIKAAKVRDWPTMRATLAGYSGYDLTALAANVFQASPEMDDWLPEAVGADTEDPIARFALGARKVERGWEIRSGLRAVHVSQDQFKAFHAHLRSAEEYLYEAAALDRTSPAPWYYLMMSARGLQMGIPVTKRRFEAIVTRSPGHLGAHRQMLQSLCKKWSGSHEQMHAFATEAMRGPHGLKLGELAPIAHLERWLDLASDARRAYMTSQPVRTELLEAAERSVFHPDFAMPRAPVAAYNIFAMAFHLAGLHEQARIAFKATGGIVTRFPWMYINGADQVAPYTKAREISFRTA
ncbi:MAG TPA: hypothetical protein VFU65_14475 [Actinocrinis sp.]|nr:hypothetical protein [Actinocrinis sp.]